MKSFKQTLCFCSSNKKGFSFSTVIFVGAQNAQMPRCSFLSQTHFLPSVCSLLYPLGRQACVALCCNYNHDLRSQLSIISSLSLIMLSLLFLSLGLVSYPLPGETNASVWPLSITARPLHHPAPLPPNA